jgi:hypothetical protein
VLPYPIGYASFREVLPQSRLPHRKRVKSPAEFLDRLSFCSDCGAPLVLDERDAVEGVSDGQLAKEGPYRGPAAHTRSAKDDMRGAERTIRW